MNRRQFHTIRKTIECHRSIRLFNKCVLVHSRKLNDKKFTQTLFPFIYLFTYIQTNEQTYMLPIYILTTVFNFVNFQNLKKTLIINIQLKLPNIVCKTLGKKGQSQLYLIRVEREPPCYCRSVLK